MWGCGGVGVWGVGVWGCGGVGVWGCGGVGVWGCGGVGVWGCGGVGSWGFRVWGVGFKACEKVLPGLRSRLSAKSQHQTAAASPIAEQNPEPGIQVVDHPELYKLYLRNFPNP